VRPVATVRCGGEYDAAPVWCPGRSDVLAGGAELPTKARALDELRAGEQITGSARSTAVEGLHEQMRTPVIEPAVPEANRGAVVHARVVLARFPLCGGGTIRRVGRGAGIYHAGEENGIAIGTPLRARGARRNVGDPLRLATAGQIEHVDLRHIVAFAPRAERDATAVGTPIDTVLAALRVRQPSRLGASVDRHEPEIADLIAIGIRGLGHAEDDPPAVGTDGRRRDPLHEKHIFVCDRVATRGSLLGREWREEEEENEREAAHASLPW
jgi:hypothetical protein